VSGTILLADDDKATNEALQRALRLAGYQVRPVADGAAALAAATAGVVGAVLLVAGATFEWQRATVAHARSAYLTFR
jgi:DNA-binding response OmpR family regulator